MTEEDVEILPVKSLNISAKNKNVILSHGCQVSYNSTDADLKPRFLSCIPVELYAIIKE